MAIAAYNNGDSGLNECSRIYEFLLVTVKAVVDYVPEEKEESWTFLYKPLG
jgi:hypothetical protein